MKNIKSKWLLLAVVFATAYSSYGQRMNESDQRRDERMNRQSENRMDRLTERDLIDAYKKGYEDGMEDARRETRQGGRQEMNRQNRDSDNTGQLSDQKQKTRRPYQSLTGGFYAGANSTRYRGEDVDGNELTGRLGYQLGVFVRGGGRIYGQIGAEYFTSSSNFFRPGDNQGLNDITGRIDTRWVQIPAYVGVKLVQSKRGVSAIRLAVGAEYANRLSNSTNTVDLDQSEIKSGTFLALGNLGFDAGPFVIDLVYHHGLSDAIQNFTNSQRRSLGVNVGFKF